LINAKGIKMAIEIKAPSFPESVADGEVAAWHKSEGESVARDELLVEIETDKVVMEVVAPEDGVITAIHAPQGETIQSEQLLATLEQGAVAATAQAEPQDQAVTESSSESQGGQQMGPAARQLVE
jgi:2-oxoglutarate dehydrogenase E2 component (dihydrolipoamide succinyltransferase)